MKNYVDAEKLQEYTTKLVAKLKEIFPGPAQAASTVAEMTDESKVYVYTGSETGYTAGNWYYWDGTAWTSGGVYNAVQIETDTTLTETGEAADAKATGDAIAAAKAAVLADLAPAYSTSATYAVGAYVVYNGGLYRCITAISTAEAWTAAHWTAVDLANDVGASLADLKSAIALSDGNPLSYSIAGTGHVIKYADGTVSSEELANFSWTDYVDVSDFAYIAYKRTKHTIASPIVGMAFYDASKTYISGVQAAKNQSSIGYETDLYRVSVPETAVYARFSTYADTETYGSFAVTGDPKIYDQIKSIESALDPLLIDTYNKLDVNALTPNKYEPTGTGAPANYNGWSLSDYIPITSNDNYYFVIKNADNDNYSNVTGSNLYVGYYNAGKTKIAGAVGSPIHNSDTGLAYVRVSAPTDYFSRYAMVVDAATRSNISTIADYEEFGKKTIPVAEEISAIKSRLSDAEADIDEIQQVIGGGAKAIDADVTAVMEKIPDYYTDYLPAPPTSFDDDSYLESKIKQIPDGYSIIHISDVHCDHGTDYNAWHSIDLMNYVRKRANIGKVLFSGDILNVIQNTYDSEGHVLTPSKYTAKKELAKFLYGCRRVFRDDFYAAVGDHDANLAGSFDTDYKTEAYAGQYVPYGVVEPLFFGDLKNRHNAIEYYQDKLDAIHDRGTDPISDDDYNELTAFFKTVFYIDDPQNKIRWITMDCGKSAAPYGAVYNVFGITSTEIFRIQYEWLNNVLLNTPAGYNIILHSHKASFNSGSMRGAIKMLNALKNKTSCNPDYTTAGSAELEAWWAYNTSYNYATAPDIGWTLSIAGHTHEDDIYVKGGGYDFSKYAGATLTDSSTPCVEINCDAYSTMVGHTTEMEYGTITEQCFDVMTFVDDGIVMTRFGAGNDRRIYIDRS